jgi:hypothetical protein
MNSDELRTRRAFAKQIASATIGAAIAFPNATEAQIASLLPTIIRWGPRLARVGGGIAGFVLTEVVLGVLKAYDIDIAGSVERLVRTLSDGGSTDRNQRRRRLVVVNDPKSVVNVIVNVSGTCPRSGSKVSLLFDGYDVCRPSCELQVLVPGVSLWAALRDDRPRGCLRDQQCGHPLLDAETKNSGGRNYSILKQQYEHGYVRLVLDSTYGFTPEAVFDRNLSEMVWVPMRS